MLKRLTVTHLSVLILASLLAAACQAQSRSEKVQEDRRRVEADGFWIYNDLPQAFAEAERTGKPILVGLRCIPCEECVKLDDDLVDTDPTIRPLLEQFVCVRVVATNGLDLSLFQFDTDQSFAMFMLNADRTIYGRFGTRSHRTEWLGDVSLKGLAVALQKALDLHQQYPANKQALAAKSGDPLEFSTPEQYPALKNNSNYSSKLDYSGDVAQSCIHCHQIGDARRELHREAGKPIPEKLVYPYPHPKTVGLTLDPQQAATIKEVASDSPAAEAGFQAGDKIQTLNGQPLISVADVQWVLHNADPKGTEIPAQVERDGAVQDLTLKLQDNWRSADDIGWRVSSWAYRGWVTGGLKLDALDADERRQLKLSGDQMALEVEHLGQYGIHGAAKRAGFQKGDVVTSFDGRSDFDTEGDLLAYGVRSSQPGQKVPVTVLRNGRQLTLTLPMQK